DAAHRQDGAEADGAQSQVAERLRNDRRGRQYTRLGPAEVAAEELVQAPVRLGEVCVELLPRLWIHARVVAREDPWVRGEFVRRRAEKVEHLAVRLAGSCEQVAARHDEQPLAREVAEPPLELLRVTAAREIGEVPPR